MAYKLNKVGLLMDYKKEFMQCYMHIIGHQEETIRLLGIYNLPCMHMLFKEVQ